MALDVSNRLTEEDYEMIRQALDECTPDLPPLSKKHATRTPGPRREMTLEMLDARGRKLTADLNAARKRR
jgi:hypothetical protein